MGSAVVFGERRASGIVERRIAAAAALDDAHTLPAFDQAIEREWDIVEPDVATRDEVIAGRGDETLRYIEDDVLLTRLLHEIARTAPVRLAVLPQAFGLRLRNIRAECLQHRHTRRVDVDPSAGRQRADVRREARIDVAGNTTHEPQFGYMREHALRAAVRHRLR